jgi:PAS domain S-box-containing protein
MNEPKRKKAKATTGEGFARPTPAEMLERVLALGRDIHFDMDERQLADRFLRTLEELFPSRFVAVRLVTSSGERVVAASSGSRLRASALDGPFLFKRSSLEKTKIDPEAVASGSARPVDVVETVFEDAAGGFSLPLVAHSALYGALDVGYPLSEPLESEVADDEALVIPLANHLSVALRNVRLHAEADLLRDYLAKLVEHANALIVGVDRDWRVTVFNQAVSKLTGISRGEVLGKDIRYWLPPAERSRLTAEIGYAFAGKRAASVEVDLANRSGGVVRTVWNIAAIRQGRNVEAVVAVGSDVTQLKSLERQVIQAEKLATLGQMAAGVVHELNNPLTSIAVYAAYLMRKAERGQPLDPHDAEKLRRILDGAERIQHFTRDLVQYAKPTSSRHELVSLNDVVRQALSFCEHILAGRVELVCDLDAELPSMMAARDQLQQVVINLVTNAVQALKPDGGRVRLRTFARSSRHIALLVEDDGVGVKLEDRERIFDPFYTTKTDGKGTGLGLSIVRNIVERHHGSITLESESGRGTTFTVVLPIGR